MIDLRSDLMTPRTAQSVGAMTSAALRAPSMTYREDADERALYEVLEEELGVEAALLVPTCTMANQIAVRLHLPEGGVIASSPLAHIVTVEARATRLTGVGTHSLKVTAGHPLPQSIDEFIAHSDSDQAALVWLENTHMLSAGSVIPDGWQERIGNACASAGHRVHLDGSRLWNAAVAGNASMATLTRNCDTVSISLNKSIGAPVGSVLVGSRALIDESVRWRDAMGGEWRPIGGIAAAARVALEGWRERLETDATMTKKLAGGLADRLGEHAVHPAPTNLVFLNVQSGAAHRFVELLAGHGIGAITLTPDIVRFAVHSGVREHEVQAVLAAVTAIYRQLSDGQTA